MEIKSSLHIPLDFSNFINTNKTLFDDYRIIFQSCIDASQPSIFLLGEEHQNQDAIKLNGKFISHLAGEKSALLCEGVDYDHFEKLNCTRTELQNLQANYIDYSNDNHFSLFGWDYENLDDEVGYCFWKEEELFQSYAKSLNLVMRLTVVIDELNKDKKNLSSLIETKEFVNHNFTLDSVNNEYDALCECIKMASETLEKEEAILFKKFITIKKGVATFEQIEKTFPKRVSSMVESIKKIEVLKKKGRIQNAFWVAGYKHLYHRLSNPAFDLSPLYEELKKHNCMVLVPKNLDKTFKSMLFCIIQLNNDDLSLVHIKFV